MEIHEEFTKWVLGQGVTINHIKPHRFEDRGLGIVAQQRIEAGAIILSVPRTALYSRLNVSQAISSRLDTITVHGLLASELAISPTATGAAWRATMPSLSDLHNMPILWDPEIQTLLPQAASLLVANQQQKLASDWSTCSRAFPEIAYRTYVHAWLLINTRTFYYVAASHRGPPPPRDDCMALNPFADYFNHDAAPTAVVEITGTAYRVRTCARVEKGAEIAISYGNHSNDFLLAEYGFLLDDNHCDTVLLDDYILVLLDPSRTAVLQDAGFLGNYVLDRKLVCYRTEVALGILCLPLHRWQCLIRGEDHGDEDQAAINKILSEVLQKYKKNVARALDDTLAVGDAFAAQRRTLEKRWRQIDLLLQSAIDRIQC